MFFIKPGLLPLSVPSTNSCRTQPKNHLRFASRPSPLARTSRGHPMDSRYSATSSRCSLVMRSPNEYFHMVFGMLSKPACRGSRRMSIMSRRVRGGLNSSWLEGWSLRCLVARLVLSFLLASVLHLRNTKRIAFWTR